MKIKIIFIEIFIKMRTTYALYISCFVYKTHFLASKNLTKYYNKVYFIITVIMCV